MASKVVVITGCSEGGIGYTMAKEFASRGCTVYATARNMEKMKGLQDLPNIHILRLDVTDDNTIKTAIDSIIKRESKIDIIINNAGLAVFGPILEVPLDQVESVYQTNVFSVLRVTRVVLPYMAKRNSGLIVNIGSITGEVPTPWSGVYASSKSAVHAISEVLDMECRPFNIKVMLVSPGGIRTKVAENASPLFALGQDSLYTKYLNNILRRIWASQTPDSLSAEEFARLTADKALAQSPPPYLTMGSYSLYFGFLKWLPRTMVHNRMWRSFGTLTGP